MARQLILLLAAGALAAADAPPAPAPTPLAPRTAAADVAPAQPGTDTAAAPLTLAEALRAAAGANETATIARERLRRAAASERQSFAQLLPSLSAGGSVSRTSRSYRPLAAPRAPFASDSASLDLTLIDPAAYPALAAARADRAAQELDSRELMRGLAFQVVGSFLQVIADERQLDAAGRRVAVAQRIVDEGRARVAAGVATANDQTRNELELITAQGSRTNAQLAARTARLTLGFLVGAATSRPLAEPEAAALPSGDADALSGFALAHRADLLASGERIRGLALIARGERLGYAPTLGASAGYGVADGDNEVFADSKPSWTVALNARWTLYDGGARSAAADATDASRREAQAVLASQRRQVDVDVATTLATLDAATVATQQAELQLQVARNNLDEVHARAAQGLATGLQEADANASLYEAESNLIGKRLALAQSRYDLRRIVGWWPVTQAAPAAVP